MQLKYADITEKIIGCAMSVHSKMGPDYPEIIYARCLTIEFNRISLRYEKEKRLNVYYDEFIVGGRRVDFMAEEKIAVALKAMADLADEDFVHSLNYLESHRREIALLLNFGAKSLQFKRIIHNKNVSLPANPVNLISEPHAEYNPDHPLKNQDTPWFIPDNPFTNPDHPWSNPWS